MIDLLLERVSLTDHPVDIDQICVNMRLDYDAHLNLLKEAKGKNCNRDNYKLLLFGH